MQPPKKTKEKVPKNQPRAKNPSPGPTNIAPDPTATAMAALSTALPTTDRNISAAVSNIAAVRVPTGATKSFQVAGAIGKLATNDVVLATSGSRYDSRSAASLLQGKNQKVGTLSGGGGTGKVRGVVDKMPARAVSTTGGFLRREDILAVVNAGIRDVQACYERQLLHAAGLQGKLVMDWVIDLSGAVESTRVRSSSLNSQEVATCVSQVIKGWHFPHPSGGSVKVTFPFVFSVQGF
jgi:outer membrane biosynthesis protein TonB